MRTFKCVCSNTIFFENTHCLTCEHELGWCPSCETLTTLLPTDDGQLQCGWEHCGQRLAKCHNYAVENVCNRCLAVESGTSDPEALCDYCRFNNTIPDLSIAGNREKWCRLETAKRRLMYTLDLLQLPYGSAEEGFVPPLSFDFKSDLDSQDDRWSNISDTEQVFTGHADGNITINLREADDVEREKARVDLNEAQRTLIGHFRHEIGHYYWDLLVKGQGEDRFKAVFGDHENPNYADALKKHYEAGPPANWQQNFISAYSTMHPWEDFAEVFAAYLDMTSILDTTYHLGLAPDLKVLPADFNLRVARYAVLGVKLNEINRAMGLIDLVPDVFVPPVVEKMRYIHELVQQAARRPKNATKTGKPQVQGSTDQSGRDPQETLVRQESTLVESLA